MKKIFFLFAMAAVLATTITEKAPAQATQKITVPQDVEKWITTSFGKGKLPPFSFLYNDKNSAGFIRKWKHSLKKQQSDNSNIIAYIITYTDPTTGLEVKCEVNGFKEFNAVEWVIHFTNTSQQNTPQIKQVKALDYTMQALSKAPYQLLSCKGSNGARADFMAKLEPIDIGNGILMKPEHGRSSDTSAFPFFNVISPDNTGAVVAIGWTGEWYASLNRIDEKSLMLHSGMNKMDLHLLPGETIRTPRIAMLFWHGEDFMIGNNSFRRFMLAHHTHKVDNAYAHAPLCGGFNWGDPTPCNEYGCLTEDYAIALINRHKQFNITPEVFWLDAGWYTGSGGPNFEGRNWYNQVGNWTVDKERFPNGLKPISDAAHKIGAKFMVWFEPERVFNGTQFAREHPEWLLSLPSGGDNMLFNLGNKQALDWLCKYIGDLIEENGIDYYRQDFNMPVNGYWEANDAPNRIGISEIRHIEGLYAYWDYLLERFPNMIIDNCASGGRRLDLETMSRSLPLWRTDYHYGEVNGYQCHTYALNFFLPLHGTGVYGGDHYNFRSSMSSAMVTNWEVASRNGSLSDMQRSIKQFKELRPYYMEDYYPLTGINDLTADNVWLAYQLNRPSDNSGIVMAFRRSENSQNEITVQLKGLALDQTYVVRNDNDGSVSEVTGKQLTEGIALKIDNPRGSLMLQYAPKR